MMTDAQPMIITILTDDSAAHAYRVVRELLSTKDHPSADSIRFFDNQGHRLEPRVGPRGQLLGLVRAAGLFTGRTPPG